MFRELFLFELYYRRRRATSFVYLFLIFSICFIIVTIPDLELGAGRAGNSPFIIMVLMVLLSAFFSLITAAVIGVSVIRDYDYDVTALLFTTSIDKGSYLFGRFAGALVVVIVMHMAMIPGFMLGYAIGPYLPWEVAWRNREMLPFDLWMYVQPFLLFVVSNIFITGSIFFCVGALVKRPVVIYSQAVIFIVLWRIANDLFLSNPERQWTAALIDPFCIHPVIYMTRYWTPLQQNSLVVPFEGVMLYNRLLWFGIAILILLFTYWRFSFSTRGPLIRRSKKIQATDIYNPQDIPIPVVVTTETLFSKVKQVLLAGSFYLRTIWKEVPFIAIVGTAMIVLVTKAISMGNMYGTSSYPTTSAVLATLLEASRLYMIILLVFYSGEVVWKEREQKINSITDTSSMPSARMLASKFMGLALMYILFFLAILVVGVLSQVGRGYYNFDFQAYFGLLFLEFVSMCLLTVIAVLIQVLSSSKFLGFILTVTAFLIIFALAPLAFEHDLLSYAGGTLGVFSEMNGFGHFVEPFTWLKTYWITFAFIILIPALILYRRGMEKKLSVRWKLGRQRFSGSVRAASIMITLIFVASGAYIYYNVSILNHFESTREIKARQVRYEKELKQFESIPQPKIVEVNINVDLFPARRSFKATGYYYLKNRETTPIKQVQVQQMNSAAINLHDVSFGRNAELVGNHTDLGYYVYDISPPLEPGDSLRMDFALDFMQKGFKGKGSNTDLVYNGTFFHNNYFPTIGYDRNRELVNREERSRFALAARNDNAQTNSPQRNVFGQEADRIRFNALVSTDSSQIAVAPGELLKDWYENNRHYHQYQAKGTIPDSYAILSGKYSVRRDKWNDVGLEIFFHPAHQYNVDRMMQSLKDGLSYYTKSFGPFPHSQLKVVEFPKYTTSAQSFPGMIAFSEGVSFVLKIADPAKDLDVPYYVTAHELAHQWWGQQVMEANQAGRSLLSEGMAQYSALMVMDHTFPIEVMQRFLKYELDAYLKGRSLEKMNEVPLLSVNGQQYVSYNKSALAFFSIQDYIGEDSVNSAFRRFHKKWAFHGPPYPTAQDLIDEVRASTPDSLKYLISDIFDNITLYENTTQEAAYRALSQERYEVTMTLLTQKLQVDSLGREVAVPIDDWIDVGVFGTDGNGKEKLIYLKKHKFSRQKSTLTIVTRGMPTKVGIDPLYKLVDHHSNDNVIAVGTVVELANSPLGY